MKKKSLKLSRETLRRLSPGVLQTAAGGVTGACTYSGCNGGCTTDTTATLSKVRTHCPITFGTD